MRFDVAHDGSLYLNLLACCYLAAPEGAEPVLAHELDVQARSEGVEIDDVLTALLLAVPA